MKLFPRLFLILMLFSTLPLAGLGAWMLSGRRVVRENARVMHGRLAALTAEQAERTLEQLNRSLGVVEELERSPAPLSAGTRGASKRAMGTEMPLPKSSGQAAVAQARLEERILGRAAAADTAVALMAIVDASGREVVRMIDPDVFSTANMDRSSDTTIGTARKTGLVSLGDPLSMHGRTFVPAAHPLADGRCLYLLYSLEGLARRMQRISTSAGRLLFVDAAGRPVSGVGSPPPTPDWRWPVDGEDWLDDVSGDGGAWVAAAAPVPALGWRAVSLQLRREAYAEESAGAARAAAFFLSVCALVAGGAYLLSSRLMRPVELLLSASERVASNDFSRPVPPLGWGEFERLRSTFNAMMEKVRLYQGSQVEKIMEEKAKIDALVINIPEGVLLVGHGGQVLYSNNLAIAILGVDTMGKHGGSSIRVKWPKLMQLLNDVRAGDQSGKIVPIEIETILDGKSKIYFCQAVLVARGTNAVGTLVLMRDVTLERDLDRMKEEFFHSLVHDLRGPLTVINGIVDFMKKKPDINEKEKRYSELGARASEHLAGLITNILDIAKIESGTMPLNIAGAQAETILESALNLYQIPADGKRITLAAASAPGVELACDTPLIERVLMNLLGNALKFTPAGGHIELSARIAGTNVEFAVQDSGPGIPADKLDAIFEKFKQLDRDTAARAGYGLGLSICRKIVELHGGRIWVESLPGQGSRFVFLLPRVGPSRASLSSRA